MEQPKGTRLHPPGERDAHSSAPVPTHQWLSTLSRLGAGPVLITPITQPLRSSPAQVTPSLFQGFIFPSPSFSWHFAHREVKSSAGWFVGDAEHMLCSEQQPLSTSTSQPGRCNPPEFTKASSKREMGQQPWRGDAERASGRCCCSQRHQPQYNTLS